MTMTNIDEAKIMLKELIIGIVGFACLAAIGGSFLSVFFAAGDALPALLRFLTGMIFGTAMAVFMVKNMFRTLDRSLDMDQKRAASYSKKMSMLRMAVMVVFVFISVFFSAVCSVWGIIIGIFCLKFAALFQPLTHKMIYKIQNKGR